MWHSWFLIFLILNDSLQNIHRQRFAFCLELRTFFFISSMQILYRNRRQILSRRNPSLTFQDHLLLGKTTYLILKLIKKKKKEFPAKQRSSILALPCEKVGTVSLWVSVFQIRWRNSKRSVVRLLELVWKLTRSLWKQQWVWSSTTAIRGHRTGCSV